jgi:polysulfide reductase chain C
MEPIILQNTKWDLDLFVPLYLFFGGLAGGLYVVAVICDLVAIRYETFRKVSRVAAYTALPVMVLAGLAITFHLGKPERGLAFPLFFTNYNSWMVRGGWIVGAAAPWLAVYGALWYFGVSDKTRRIVGVVGIPLLAGLALYTGMLLSGAVFVPLWSRAFLPMLFLNSALTTGIAAAGLMLILAWPYIGKGEDRNLALRGLAFAAIAVIVLELVELYSFMQHLQTAREGPAVGEFRAPYGGPLAYAYLTSGPLALWFWVGIIGVGLVLPLVLTLFELIVRRWITPIAATKFAFMLAGGLMLRMVIVWGGKVKSPLPFPSSNWPIPPPLG